MPNPILALIEKHAGPDFVPRLQQQIAGLAADFWKDAPTQFPIFELKLAGRTLKIPNLLRPIPADTVPTSAPAKVAPTFWHALPGEVSEKMWGDGHVLPAADVIFDMLVNPLGLTKEKNLLDLSAGLGAPLRKLVGRVGQIKGCETDAAIAARGMSLSDKDGKAKLAPIAAYDPAVFSAPAIYDAVLARELFYRIADKPKFFYSIAAAAKPQGQIAFTDYILEPEDRAKRAITAWQAFENDARPLSLAEMTEAWAKVGFELRVSEDQTPMYKQEIAHGLKRFVVSLRIAPPADAETKLVILRLVETWIRRAAALEQGMKFYRFQGVKS